MPNFSEMPLKLASEIARDFFACANRATRKSQAMKIKTLCYVTMLTLASSLAGSAKESVLAYKFVAGTTNVFSVEVSLRNDSGSQVITGKVFIVTKEAAPNFGRVSCRLMLDSEIREMPRAVGGYPGYSPSPQRQRMFPIPNECQMEFDSRGVEIRDGGDLLLPVPLGKLLQCLHEPIPDKFGEKDSADAKMVLDEPFWLGPADNFQNISPNIPRLGMKYIQTYNQPPPATWLVMRNSSTSLKSSADNTVEWHKHTVIHSLSQHDSEPLLVGSGESDYSFDRNKGAMARVEIQGEFTVQTESFVRRSKVGFKSRLLVDEELASALAQIATVPRVGGDLSRPASPQKLTTADLEKIAEDLHSPSVETRRAAIRKLITSEMETPPLELVHALGAVALEDDPYSFETAASLLGNYATSNEIPVLLKMLASPKGSSRWNAARAFSRIKEPQAAQLLVDWIAREGANNTQDAVAAVINIGAPAEKTVLALLGERRNETRRIACTILQQIGTTESLDAMQKLVGDSDQATSQAAAEAVRNIKLRQ